MEAMRESWTDDRLNNLNERMTERFDRVDQRFAQVDHRFEQVDQRFEQVDHRFDRLEADVRGLRTEMNTRFDAMQRLLIQFCAGTLAAMGAAIVGLVATQL